MSLLEELTTESRAEFPDPVELAKLDAETLREQKALWMEMKQSATRHYLNSSDGDRSNVIYCEKMWRAYNRALDLKDGVD
jgi:hypothetical protein